MNNLTPRQSETAQENLYRAWLRMRCAADLGNDTELCSLDGLCPRLRVLPVNAEGNAHWDLVAWFDGIETRYGWEIVGGDAHHRHEKNWATAEQAAAALILSIVKRRLGEELLKGP